MFLAVGGHRCASAHGVVVEDREEHCLGSIHHRADSAGYGGAAVPYADVEDDQTDDE